VGNVGLESVTDNDSASLVQLYSSLVGVQLVSVGLSSSGYQNVISLQDLLLSTLNWLNGNLTVSSVVFSTDDLV
jgi:hypothetical protein